MCSLGFAMKKPIDSVEFFHMIREGNAADDSLAKVSELPPVDMFVTTADPVLEPPIITVNTVLSLLAVDYPAHKLACYVSDDSGSSLIFYSLVEASKFAKLWVPFCKKYSILVRAPFRYFSVVSVCWDNNSLEFQQEWRKMKDEYELLSQKIEDAVQNSMLCNFAGDFEVFSNIECRNLPSIIKVICDNKERLSDGLPHLVYVSREKSPKHRHQYKAGAMNVLTRVSGVMTNAPFMLNVDCDMYANNPQIVLHAMCMLLGSNNERDCAFVQSPQFFYNTSVNSQFVMVRYLLSGIAGLQGPLYAGTGCFHRRKIIYGTWPDGTEIKRRNLTSNDENLTKEGLHNKFGNSIEFNDSAAKILSDLKEKADCPNDLSSLVEAAYKVSGCCYEHGTSWGRKVGWLYGSTNEDVLTGLMIHAKGWRSIFCTPVPPAFLGCAPLGGPSLLIQQKRWATGLLEIFFSRNNPFIICITGKIHFRQSLAYVLFLVRGLRSILELCYAALPAYCIITNSYFLPQDIALFLPIAVFVTYNLHSLSEYIQAGISIRVWWKAQQMGRIASTTSWLFGFFSVMLKLLGLSEIVFEVTEKSQATTNNGVSSGRFTFDESPIFVPGATLVLVHLLTLFIGILRLQPLGHSGDGSGIGEIACSGWWLFCFWPFLEGLFRKGECGIPTSTICKSAALAFLFVHLCKLTSMK